MPVKRESGEPTPEAQIRSCIARLEPKTRTLIRSVRAAVRKRFPTANELIYDYDHSFVIGYSPTDRGIDSIVALSARADGVFLYFHQGPKLSDPERILQGSGKATRFIKLEAVGRLSDPDVEAFIAATIDQARIPFPSSGQGSVIIRTAAANRRPKRKAKK